MRSCPGFWGRERRFSQLRFLPAGKFLRLPAVGESGCGASQWHIITSGTAEQERSCSCRPKGSHGGRQRRWVPGRWAQSPEELHRGLLAGGALRDLQRGKQEECGQLGQLHRGVRFRRLPWSEQFRLQLSAGAAGETHPEAAGELPGPER